MPPVTVSVMALSTLATKLGSASWAATTLPRNQGTREARTGGTPLAPFGAQGKSNDCACPVIELLDVHDAADVLSVCWEVLASLSTVPHGSFRLLRFLQRPFPLLLWCLLSGGTSCGGCRALRCGANGQHAQQALERSQVRTGLHR